MLGIEIQNTVFISYSVVANSYTGKKSAITVLKLLNYPRGQSHKGAAYNVFFYWGAFLYFIQSHLNLIIRYYASMLCVTIYT